MTPKELVSKVRNLPPASPAAIQLIGLLGHQSAGNEEVVQVIRQDPVLTAKLLRACNSSRFAFEDPVSSVDQAVLILGYQEILRQILAVTLSEAMMAPLPGYAVEANELWEHSLTTAIAAEIIVAQGCVLQLNSATAFTIGLLHDIGKLVLGQILTPEMQADIRDDIKARHLSRTEAEKQILGTDHAEVGAHLLQTWRLPEEIVEATANHHRPVLEPRPGMSVLAHAANCLAHLAGSAPGWEACATRVSAPAIAMFDLVQEKLEETLISIREKGELARQAMKPA